MSTSPDKHWCLYLESGRSDRQYARISIFDTKTYPELAVDGTFPTALQSRNALARYIIPVNLSARMTGVSWEGDRVTMRQEALNGQKAIAFTVDLLRYSLSALE